MGLVRRLGIVKEQFKLGLLIVYSFYVRNSQILAYFYIS
jgi:hypothetical protein